MDFFAFHVRTHPFRCCVFREPSSIDDRVLLDVQKCPLFDAVVYQSIQSVPGLTYVKEGKGFTVRTPVYKGWFYTSIYVYLIVRNRSYTPYDHTNIHQTRISMYISTNSCEKPSLSATLHAHIYTCICMQANPVLPFFYAHARAHTHTHTQLISP